MADIDPSPAPSARWRRRKEDRPGEILAAALACFAERGYAATRLDDVARRAGVTKGTLYLYFPNKEELFKAVVRQAIVPNLAQAEALVAAASEPPALILGRLLKQWLALHGTPASAIPKLMLAEAGNFPDLARFYHAEVVERGTNVLRRLLHRAVERGDFRAIDVDHAVFCIIGPVLLSMLWRHSFQRHDSHALDAEALYRTHLDLLTRGLLPDRGAAARKTSHE
ncbi:MAG TPA: TetR/AcrR family transcriptional regulator [Stellaceae bacterium]|nr:TetR/AcrR family transcriptional regulator [Stellaceae bacterium]